MKKDSPNSYKNFFAEPFYYADGNYGYAVHAKNTEDAFNKFVAYFDDWHWIVDKKYLKADLRKNMKNCWVRWKGYQDDDGEFYNGWVITEEYHGGEKYWFHVYCTNYDKHYVLNGHHFEPKVLENGRPEYSRGSCNVCNKRWWD